jgi:hypothetical protein
MSIFVMSATARRLAAVKKWVTAWMSAASRMPATAAKVPSETWAPAAAECHQLWVQMHQQKHQQQECSQEPYRHQQEKGVLATADLTALARTPAETYLYTRFRHRFLKQQFHSVFFFNRKSYKFFEKSKKPHCCTFKAAE